MLYPLEPLTRDISGIESCSNVAIRQSCGSLATFENCVKQDQDGGWAKIKEFRQILINTNIFHWQSRGPPCPNFRSCVTHAYDQSGWHSNHWIWKVSRNRRNGEIPWIRQGEVTEYGKCLERWGGRTQGMWHYFDAIYLSKQALSRDFFRHPKNSETRVFFRHPENSESYLAEWGTQAIWQFLNKMALQKFRIILSRDCNDCTSPSTWKINTMI